MSAGCEKVPEPVSDEERWIVKNRVVAIRVENRMTGVDTADTYVTMTTFEGKKATWRDTTFNKLARLRLSWPNLCEPNYGLREKVEAREKWEKANAAELATYRRLQAKYGNTPAPPTGASE